MTDPVVTRDLLRPLTREALRAGTVAGLAMIPFAAAFRFFGLRVNEYGRKSLELLVGEVTPPVHFALTFVMHLVISWLAAVPLLVLLRFIAGRRARLLAGFAYGAVFYVAVNSLALPIAFGDSTPWELGFTTIYPSLVIHLVFGVVVAMMVQPALPTPGRDVATPSVAEVDRR